MSTTRVRSITIHVCVSTLVQLYEPGVTQLHVFRSLKFIPICMCTIPYRKGVQKKMIAPINHGLHLSREYSSYMPYGNT